MFGWMRHEQTLNRTGHPPHTLADSRSLSAVACEYILIQRLAFCCLCCYFVVVVEKTSKPCEKLKTIRYAFSSVICEGICFIQILYIFVICARFVYVLHRKRWCVLNRESGQRQCTHTIPIWLFLILYSIVFTNEKASLCAHPILWHLFWFCDPSMADYSSKSFFSMRFQSPKENKVHWSLTINTIIYWWLLTNW